MTERKIKNIRGARPLFPSGIKANSYIKTKGDFIMTDLKELSYSQRKVNQLIKDTDEDLRTLLDEMPSNISDSNKSELVEDTKYYIADTLRRLEILQSQHFFLDKEDVIMCNRLIAIVNHIIKSVEV